MLLKQRFSTNELRIHCPPTCGLLQGTGNKTTLPRAHSLVWASGKFCLKFPWFPHLARQNPWRAFENSFSAIIPTSPPTALEPGSMVQRRAGVLIFLKGPHVIGCHQPWVFRSHEEGWPWTWYHMFDIEGEPPVTSLFPLYASPRLGHHDSGPWFQPPQPSCSRPCGLPPCLCLPFPVLRGKGE